MQLSEEENKDVELNTQAVVPATEPEQEQVESSQESAQEKKRRNEAEYNWAESRKKMQELERQNREMLEQVESLKKGIKPVEEKEEDFGIKDDDIVEGKHVKDLKKELKKLQSYIKEKEVSSVDERLSLKHPDFATVVTRENIELLKQRKPLFAKSLGYIPDPFEQGVAAYEMLKELGIGDEVTKSPEKEKALKNASKPVSVNAVTKQSAIGNAHLFENGLTPELKSQLWKEMKEAAKRS